MAVVNQPDDNARNPNALEFEIEAERFVIRLENAPAVVGAVGDAAVKVGVVMAGGYLAYKLANTPAFLGALTHVAEGLGEAFIEKVRAGSLEVTLIAENQQTAQTIRQFYEEGTLLQQFNIALRKYGRASNDPQIAFTKIVLLQPGNGKVNRLELESLKKKADEEMKETFINGIKYERNLHKSRSYVEIQTTEKTVTTKLTKEFRFLEEEVQHEMAQAFSSRDAPTNSPRDTSAASPRDTPTTSSRDTPTTSSRDSQAAAHTPCHERRKLEIEDIESVFGLLEIVETEKYKNAETSSDQVLDETLILMMGYFQYYKLYMQNHKFDQVGVITNKMLNLIENNFVASGDDIKSLADKILAKGNNYEAILFYEISAIFYSRENSLNAAKAISNCMFGINKSLEALSVTNKAEIKPITCDYVIPVMRDLLKSVQNMNKIEAKERVKLQSWCLYHIGDSYELAEEYDYCLSTYFEASDLMEKTYGKDVANYRLYGLILNSIGVTYHKMSARKLLNIPKSYFQEAAKYIKLAFEAAKQATDYTSAEQQSNVIEACKGFLRIVSE